LDGAQFISMNTGLDSAVRIATGLRPDTRGFTVCFPAARELLFSKESRLLWGPILPPIHWALCTISPGVKQPRCEADQLLSCSAEFENERSYTSTPPYAFMIAVTSLPLQPAYS